MGKPHCFGSDSITLGRELTQGSKTFQYLEEKKTIVIALVAASENAEAQTWLHSHCISNGAVGLLPGVVRREFPDVTS